METEAAKLAAKKMTPERLASLEKICDAIETETDETVRAELDKRFHYEIALASENRMIRNVLQSSATLIEALIKDIRIAILDDPDRGPVIDTQHRHILNALKNKEPLNAAFAMSQHMDLIDGFVAGLEIDEP
ncbi:FadR/GntR family transcriptional regulator [Acetobacterium wieringae]|uniref:FadR/GntR family transcriptional regulator n=1 Tax=Acetobacterium wieringae TaxID=52694 RepID=UPI0026F34E98|nr:FCD domain-containing protein [Acetobacterium wieringae]